MNHNLCKFVQGQYTLAPIIDSPALLSVRLDDALSPEKRLISLLDQVKRLFNQALSIRAEGRQRLNLNAIFLTQLLHPGAEELTPLVGDDLMWKPPVRPLSGINFNAIFSAILDLVLGRIGKAEHHGGLIAFQANVETGNELRCCVHCQINVWPSNYSAAVMAGNQANVRLGSVHLVALLQSDDAPKTGRSLRW